MPIIQTIVERDLVANVCSLAHYHDCWQAIA
jgi:hypothetical protein